MVKKRNPEQAFAITLACITVIGTYLLSEAAKLIEHLKSISEIVNEQNFECVIKSVGICILAQIACDSCSDFGQTALAGKIELAGKLTILIISLPLLDTLISIIQGLIT